MWINLFGRDWVVKRRRPTLVGVIGTVIGGLGVIGLTWGNIDSFKPDRVGIALLALGATVIYYKRLQLCCARLEKNNLAADEIYKTAYDRGVEDGYDDGYNDRGLEQRFSPVVVPLPLKCSDCGHALGLQPAGSVADRV